MTTVLRLDHVTKAFGPVKVIQDVSVDVIPGRVRVLLGENGAGKTTLIKMMSGIYHPDSGSVVIDDTPVELPTVKACLLYTSPSPRDRTRSRMPSSA